MKRTVLLSFLALAACAASATAEDLTGKVELGGNITSVNGNKTKFNEYRDLNSGFYGSFLLDWANDQGAFVYFSGDKFGYDVDEQYARKDSEFLFKIGTRDDFKLSLFYKGTPHNLSLDARSAFLETGTPALYSTLPNNANLSNANIAQYLNKPQFDYTIERDDFGAELEVPTKGPFFLNARFERNNTTGIQPGGASLSGIKELVVPIDYDSNNFYLNTGYRSERLIATLDGTISDFNNNTKSFTYGFNAAPPSTARTYEAPDSMNYKIGGNFMYRLPQWSTTIMARGSHSISDNTIGLNEETGVTTSPGVGSFHGQITYTTASAAITTSPTKEIDIKTYLNFLDKQNDSTGPIRYSVGTFNPATGTTEKFAYTKLNGGLDLGFKLPAKNKLSTGYEYLRIKRTMMAPELANTSSWGVRNDAPRTEDHILYAQIKNNLLDWLTAKVRYQRMFRDSDFQGGVFYPLADNRQIKAFWRPVDTADKIQDAVKIGFDIEPMHSLTIGLEYAYKHDNYTDTTLGMQNESRHDLYLDANYVAGIFKFNPYGELEIYNNNSVHRRYQTAGAASPWSSVNDGINFNWSSKREDLSYALGMNTDVQLIKDKMLLTSNYRYEDANGNQDFGSTFVPSTAPLTDNANVDNYTKHSFSAKVKYFFTKSLNVGLGYLYENLRYADDHYYNYNYLVTSTISSGTQLTGAYANPDYEAHVGFMTVGYNF